MQSSLLRKIEDSLYAILKVGTLKAVTDLIAFGLSKLRARIQMISGFLIFQDDI